MEIGEHLYFLHSLFYSAVMPGKACNAICHTARCLAVADRTDAFNPYILLVFSIIAGKAAYRLPAIQACVIGIVLVVGAIMPDLLGYPGFPSPFLVRYSVILAIGLALFRTVWARYEESSVRI
ncbi:hypothetical protein AWU65_21895 [Paenibacillus glucanolyticus]|uniref:Uncharacterized protein n=1 Tax=Paenibacillus glucanolyticus TaxID=59843 RepID=A0A163LRS9_9BACL|nr:hypothetical protein AWU65_21895 [Paenibacillus glucanolyticus]